MALLSAELRARLPALYSQDVNRDPIVYALCCAQHKAYYAALTVMLP
jgi:hypothetical protein